jgi:hypothetical protein
LTPDAFLFSAALKSATPFTLISFADKTCTVWGYLAILMPEFASGETSMTTVCT